MKYKIFILQNGSLVRAIPMRDNDYALSSEFDSKEEAFQVIDQCIGYMMSDLNPHTLFPKAQKEVILLEVIQG